MRSRLLRALAFAAAITTSLTARPHLIPASQALFDGAAAHVAPGDELVLAAGQRGPLTLRRLAGTAERPITIRAAGALTIIGAMPHFALGIIDSRHFHLTGGEATLITVVGGANSVVVTGLSTDFELSHLRVRDSGFAGIMVKQDPTADPRTWRDAFTMRNVVIRDCEVSGTQGEGLYIGNSFYAEGHRVNATERRLPHAITGLKILRNRTRDTGCEGIQIGCATEGCEVADNVIELFGQRPFGPWQDNGLQLGEGTGGIARDNVIRDGPGVGIVVLGLGDNVITRNRIERVGQHGISCQTKPPAVRGAGYRIEDNTIVASALAPITVGAPELPQIEIIGNRFERGTWTGNPIELRGSTKATLHDNVTVAEAAVR